VVEDGAHGVVGGTVRSIIAILLLLLLVGGCGTSDDTAQARDVVERFYDAVRHDDGTTACSQLSAAAAGAVASQSGQPCASAITELRYGGGGVMRAEVYLTSARVQLRSGESTFLDRGPEGWRISAIACRPLQGPPQQEPMECEAEA
jgi:hypothetical protein